MSSLSAAQNQREMMEMLRSLRLRLSNARAEEKKAQLVVRRLEAQVKTVSQRLGGWSSSAGQASASENAPAVRVTSRQISPAAPASSGYGSSAPPSSSSSVSSPSTSNAAKFSVIDTAAMSMLPEGWSSAVDKVSGKTYFYNNHTGAVQWTAPSGGSFDLRPVASFDMRTSEHAPQAAAQVAMREGSSPGFNGKRPSFLPAPTPTGKPEHDSVFDRLTDHRYYTGAHKSRFDEEGNGNALHSPNKMGQRGTHFSVSSTYKGSTNTGTNEKFQCTSEFLVRSEANAGRWNNQHKGEAWQVKKQTHLVL